MKTEVATASRALAVAGLFDQNGHISVREGDHLLINGRQASRIAVKPEEIAVVRIADGRQLGDVEAPFFTDPAPTEIYTYAIVGSVAHFHPVYATAFAVAGRPLVTSFNHGAVFGESVPVYDEPDLVRSDDAGRALAKALGQHRAILMRGHGVVVAAEDLVACVAASMFLEESAHKTAVAATLGEPRPFTSAEVERVRRSIWQRSVLEKAWIDAVERARRAGALADLEA